MGDDVLLRLQAATEELFRGSASNGRKHSYKAVVLHRGEESGESIDASFRVVSARDIEDARRILEAELGEHGGKIVSIAPLNLSYLRRMER